MYERLLNFKRIFGQYKNIEYLNEIFPLNKHNKYL
jgi:hypothetical protein